MEELTLDQFIARLCQLRDERPGNGSLKVVTPLDDGYCVTGANIGVSYMSGPRVVCIEHIMEEAR